MMRPPDGAGLAFSKHRRKTQASSPKPQDSTRTQRKSSALKISSQDPRTPMQASGKKSMWCSPARDDDHDDDNQRNHEPEPPMETENDRLGVRTLLSLHTPPMMRSPQEKEAARHFDMHNNVISLLSTSPGSSSSDTGSTGTDNSFGPHYVARPHSSMEEPMLHGMSSVSLMETRAVTDEDKEDGEVSEGSLQDIQHPMPAHDAHLAIRPPVSGMEYLDESDDDASYVREVKMPIPLNTMTQEKVHRKRPAPSPATGGRYTPNGTEYSWYHQETSPVRAMKKPFARRELLSDDGCLSTSTGGKSSTLAKLASNLLQQLENEPAGTLLVYQPTCLDHHNDSHQESRQRLCVLGGPEGVLHKDRFKDLKWANLNELRPARLNDILRVHTTEYIQHLERACGNLPEQNKEYLVGTLYDDKQSGENGEKQLTYDEWLKTERAQKCFGVQDQPSGGSFDMDSPISKSSYMAARMAAGAVCHAIDKVLNNETKNAFVVVRPPGHHAGPNGCVEGEGFHLRPEMCTCGFCLINNVCIGASYAMNNYCAPYYTPAVARSLESDSLLESRKRVSVQRVAIVDFDIHHGNGTEEVIRNLIPHKQNYPLPPSWAPVQFSSYKPWRDEKDPDNVFFASIHLYDDDNFYPCSGVGPHGCSPELENSKNIINLPLKVLGPKYLDERLKLTSKAKRSLMEQSSKTFRDTVTKKLIPALTKFRPDLIMLSAGFDGHADDFYYFLSEDDYGWVTEQVAAVAEDCCDGRIVSVLEGGYNVVPSKFQRPRTKARKNATSNFHYAAKMHNRPVDEELNSYGSLARSVASHVTALMRASQN